MEEEEVLPYLQGAIDQGMKVQSGTRKVSSDDRHENTWNGMTCCSRQLQA